MKPSREAQTSAVVATALLVLLAPHAAQADQSVGAGGVRLQLSSSIALTVRVGYPAMSAGVSFLL